MNTSNHDRKSRAIPRWLAVAGLAASLLIPFSARADQGNDAVEILVSAAVAYAVIDAVGGFDDKDRHKHHRYVRHDRHDRYWADRHDHRRHDHRRYDHRRYDHRRYDHRRYDHRRYDGRGNKRGHDRHPVAYKRGHYHYRHDGRRYWCVSHH